MCLRLKVWCRFQDPRRGKVHWKSPGTFLFWASVDLLSNPLVYIASSAQCGFWPNSIIKVGVLWCRFDEQHSEAALGSAEGSFATGVQRQAGQAQADSMGTGGFLNPPPGEVYNGAHNTPEIPEHGTPGTVKGANLSSVGEACLGWRCYQRACGLQLCTISV